MENTFHTLQTTVLSLYVNFESFNLECLSNFVGKIYLNSDTNSKFHHRYYWWLAGYYLFRRTVFNHHLGHQAPHQWDLVEKEQCVNTVITTGEPQVTVNSPTSQLSLLLVPIHRTEQDSNLRCHQGCLRTGCQVPYPLSYGRIRQRIQSKCSLDQLGQLLGRVGNPQLSGVSKKC